MRQHPKRVKFDVWRPYEYNDNSTHYKIGTIVVIVLIVAMRFL